MRFYAYFLSAKRFQCCCERENCAENWLAVRDGNRAMRILHRYSQSFPALRPARSCEKSNALSRGHRGRCRLIYPVTGRATVVQTVAVYAPDPGRRRRTRSSLSLFSIHRRNTSILHCDELRFRFFRRRMQQLFCDQFQILTPPAELRNPCLRPIPHGAGEAHI